jgi:glutathione synthase
MKALWITDPWETLDHVRDTTLRLLQESLELGHLAFWCDLSGIRVEPGRTVVRCTRVLAAPAERGAQGWTSAPADDLELGQLDAIHYRCDPPVDRRYFEHLQLLSLTRSGSGPEIVNPVRVLTQYSDKIGPPTLWRALPPSLATSSWEALERFGKQEGRTVLKPLGDAQSRGVVLLDWSTPQGAALARQEIDRVSVGLARPVLLQRFLPEVYQGEKRLWFVDGALLGCVRKMPQAGSFVIDMDKGSACGPCELNPSERQLANAVGDGLRSEGIRLAAVDLIGGCVTDWNFTSPGMIPTMEQVLDQNLARPIVQALAREALATRLPSVR